MLSSSPTDRRLGEAFSAALAGDVDAARDLLHPEIDFRALTPRRSWEAADPSETMAILRAWFGEVTIEEVLRVESDEIGDRHRVAYRFRGDDAGDPFLVEQQAYFSTRDGLIDWMRVLCSGFRPL